jgi:hypothetical protein
MFRDGLLVQIHLFYGLLYVQPIRSIVQESVLNVDGLFCYKREINKGLCHLNSIDV